MYILLQEKCAALYSAAHTGNVTEVEKLIQSGVYVDYTEDMVS